MYDTVTNPIPKNGLFVTEPTLDDMFARIEALSNKKERAQAYMIATMVMNTCHKLVEDNILSKEVFAQ
jgi:hypothetical protein